MTQATQQAPEVIDEIIRMSDFSFERLPMLDIIGSRVAGFLPAALSSITNSACEASLTQLEYVPFGQAISTFPDPCIVAVASSAVLDGDFLVVMDAPLIISSLESSLGGEPSGRDVEPGAQFTAIEKGFGRRLANTVLAELRQSFSVIGDIVPELDRIETVPEAATVSQLANLCIQMDFGLKIGQQICRLLILFPYDALEPIQPQLSKVYLGERGDEESPWRSVMEQQIEAVTVELEVVLSEVAMPVRQIMALKPGDQILLAATEESECTVFCSGTALFQCVTGKRNNGSTAVCVTKEIVSKEEA